MTFYRFIISLVFSAACVFSIYSQQTKILTAEKHNEYGLVYTLPITAFEVEVETEREIRKAGKYYQYAKIYTGADNVVTKDEEIWRIKNVKVRPYGVPDPESRYLMQLKAGALTFIETDADGMILAINTKTDPVPSKTQDVVERKGLELEDEEYLKFMGEDYRAAISNAKKASLLGEELIEIREAKLALTRGTAETMPTDGRQLELMLASLERQEAAINAAFAGNVIKETSKRRFTFIPDGNSRKVLFRMSSFNGPVAADDYSGAPVYVKVNILEEGKLPVDAKGEEKKLPKDAVMYCIPGTASVSLEFEGAKLFEKEFEVAQFGMVFGLNPSLFTDKKEPSYAIFNTATGSLKELGIVKE